MSLVLRICTDDSVYRDCVFICLTVCLLLTSGPEICLSSEFVNAHGWLFLWLELDQIALADSPECIRYLDITVRWSPKPAFVLVCVFCKLQSSPQAAFKVCVCFSLPWNFMARDSIPGLRSLSANSCYWGSWSSKLMWLGG